MPLYFFRAKPASKSQCESILISFPAGVDVATATQYVNQHCKGDYERAQPSEPATTPEILCQQLTGGMPDQQGAQSLGDGNEDDAFGSDDGIIPLRP